MTSGLKGSFQGPVRAAVVGAVLAVVLAGCREQCRLDADCGNTGRVCEAQQCVRLEVYGVSGRTVQRLGDWPALADAGTPVFEVVAPEDRGSSDSRLFPGGYLVSSGTHLLAGYTMAGESFSDVPGKVAVHALDGGTTSYLEAKGNLSAAVVGDTFLVNGQSLDTQAQGTGVYALKPGSAASVVAVPEAGPWGIYSGATLVTSDGTGVLGFATDENVLYAVAPAQLTSTLASGTPVDLASTPVAYQGADMRGAARFGAGVAVLRGTYQQDWTVAYTDVARVALASPDGGAVEVGAPTTVLRFRDGCTRVVLMSHLGEDLLLGLEDRNGRRLVRVRAGEGASGEDKGNSQVEALDCAGVEHDAVLGTLVLRPGFTLVGSAPLAGGVSDVAIVTHTP